MANPHEDRNNVLHEAREAEHREEPLYQTGRPVEPGEIVGRKEPPFEVTGLDALSPLLAHVEFPATKEEVLARVGAARFPIDRWRTASTASLIEATGAREFRSSRELEVALNRSFHEHPPTETRGGYHWQRDDVDGRRPA